MKVANCPFANACAKNLELIIGQYSPWSIPDGDWTLVGQSFEAFEHYILTLLNILNTFKLCITLVHVCWRYSFYIYVHMCAWMWKLNMPDSRDPFFKTLIKSNSFDFNSSMLNNACHMHYFVIGFPWHMQWLKKVSFFFN